MGQVVSVSNTLSVSPFQRLAIHVTLTPASPCRLGGAKPARTAARAERSTRAASALKPSAEPKPSSRPPSSNKATPAGSDNERIGASDEPVKICSFPPSPSHTFLPFLVPLISVPISAVPISASHHLHPSPLQVGDMRTSFAPTTPPSAHRALPAPFVRELRGT